MITAIDRVLQERHIAYIIKLNNIIICAKFNATQYFFENIDMTTPDLRHELVLWPSDKTTGNGPEISRMRTLAGRLAHGFSNVLQPIGMSVETALHALEPPAVAKQSMRSALEAVSVGAGLAERLSTFASGPIEDMEILNIMEQIQEMPGIDHGSINILDYTIMDYLSIGCKADFRIAINEIILNCLESSSTESVCIISLEKKCVCVPWGGRETMLSLTFRDHGMGMTADVLKRAFDPLFSTKRSGYVRGLGLPIVEQVIQSMNGGLVVSTAPRAGTDVEILLPSIESASE